MGEFITMYGEKGLTGCIAIIFIWMIVTQQRMFQSAFKQIYDSLKPMTFTQANSIFEIALQNASLRALEILDEIIRHNNIHLPGHDQIVRNNLSEEMNSMYKEIRNHLNHFNYSGRSLDYYMDPWAESLSGVLFNELYNQGDADEERSIKNVKTFFRNIESDIEDKLNRELH